MPKKSKLSEEQKAQMKQEMARHRGHDHLTREKNYGSVTRKIAEKNWKKMLTKIALVTVQDKLHEAWNHFERAADIKDFEISLHMDELDTAYYQHLMQNKAAVTNMDKLINIFLQRVHDMQEDFHHQCEKYQYIFDEIKTDCNEMNDKYIQSFQLIIFGIGMSHKMKNTNICSENIQKLREISLDFDQINDIIINNFKTTYNPMFYEIVQVLTEYYEYTMPKFVEYNRLQNSNITFEHKMKENMNILQKKTATVEFLKSKFTELTHQRDIQLNPVKKQITLLKVMCVQMKSLMDKQYKIEQNLLINLINKSNKKIEELQKLLNTGEKILNLIQICSKLETLFEKCEVLDYNKSDLDYEDVLRGVSDCKFVKKNELFQSLTNFWVKLAEASITKKELENERNALLKENETINEYLKVKYCGCVGCYEEFNTTKDGKKYPVNIDAKENIKNYRKQFEVKFY